MRMPISLAGCLAAKIVMVEVTCDGASARNVSAKQKTQQTRSMGHERVRLCGRHLRVRTLPALVAISRCSRMLTKSCSGELRCRMSRTIMFFQLIRPMHLDELRHATCTTARHGTS